MSKVFGEYEICASMMRQEKASWIISNWSLTSGTLQSLILDVKILKLSFYLFMW